MTEKTMEYNENRSCRFVGIITGATIVIIVISLGIFGIVTPDSDIRIRAFLLMIGLNGAGMFSFSL
jgi:hypothetical protein